MKKIFAITLLLLVAISTFAQEDEERRSIRFSEGNAKLSMVSAGDGLFNINLLSHVGYGFHIVKSTDFTPKGAGCGEFFLNILEFELRPAHFLGINLGADIEVNHFHTDSHAFIQNTDKYIKTTPFSTISLNHSRQKSYINNFGLNFPLMIKGYFSGAEIGVGAEASLFLTGSNGYSYRNDYVITSVKEKGPKFNTFSYGIIASIGYGGLVLYGKFYPSKVNVLPAESVQMSYWTIGLAVGF